METDELKKLYQAAVLEHNRNPRNFREIEEATHQARGFNALCGDDLRLFLTVDDDQITDAAFVGDACAISMASASMMTEFLIGQSTDGARQAFSAFEGLMAGDYPEHPLLGELNQLGAVRSFPSRIKSARLCWHAMRAALDGSETVTTEV